MEMGKYLILMVAITKDNSKMIKLKEKDYIFMKMVIFMKDNSYKIKKVEREKCNIQMVLFILDSLQMM